MSRTKRITGLLLALLLPILAACGGGSGASPSGAEQPDASPSAAQSSEAASPSSSASGGGSSASPSSSASGGGSTSGTTAGSVDFSKLQVEDGATLRVTSWGEPSEQKINQDSFARFNQIFPNVTIEYEPVPQDYQTRVKADFAAQTNADVMYIDSSLMTALAPNDQLLDLTQYAQQAGVNQDDYLGQLAAIFVQDNKLYGLPKDQGALVLFVRNDLAQKAGVDPASLKTWDDWRNAAQKMTADGVFGQCSSTEWQRIGALWLQQGVQAVQDGKVNLTDPKIIEATNFWTDMYKNKIATLPKEVGADWCGQAFGQGKVAMVMEGGWMIPAMQQDFADVQYTAIPIPTPPNGKQASLVYTNAWGAAANTKFPNAAAALAMYLTSAENQKPIMETGFALPTVASLLEDPYFEQNPNSRVVAEAGEYGTPANLALGSPETYDDVAKAINTQGIEPVFLGSGDVEQGLQAAQQEAQTVVDSAPQQ